MRYTTKQIREFISCPELGDEHYGKWGSLKLEQRLAYYDLLKIIEGADCIIKDLNNQLKEIQKRNSDVSE